MGAPHLSQRVQASPTDVTPQARGRSWERGTVTQTEPTGTHKAPATCNPTKPIWLGKFRSRGQSRKLNSQHQAILKITLQNGLKIDSNMQFPWQRPEPEGCLPRSREQRGHGPGWAQALGTRPPRGREGPAPCPAPGPSGHGAEPHPGMWGWEGPRGAAVQAQGPQGPHRCPLTDLPAWP